MSDPIVLAATSAIKSLREGMAVGAEVEKLVADISSLGEAELNARSQLRQKQRVVRGDTTIKSALAEWERLKEIRDAEERLRAEILKLPDGRAKWEEILRIKQRMQSEREQERLDRKSDAQKMFFLKLASFGAAAVVVLIFYAI